MAIIKIAGRDKTRASTAAKPKSTATRKRTTSARTTPTGSPKKRRRPTTDDPKVIKKHIKLLQEAGEYRKQTELDHTEAVELVYQATRDAMAAGVPTGVITKHAHISRQWLYKMGDHQDRPGDGSGAVPVEQIENGNAPKGRKPAAKKTSSAKKIKIRR